MNAQSNERTTIGEKFEVPAVEEVNAQVKNHPMNSAY